VPRSTLAKMLKAAAAIDAEALYAVCEALGVDVREVIARAEESLPPDDLDLPVE
jgi:transcriptional regulator with XRE-family HTH domain